MLTSNSYFSRHYFSLNGKYVPLLFHPSDWFFFGLTEDIKKFFCNTECMDTKEAGSYIKLKNLEIKIYMCYYSTINYVNIAACKEQSRIYKAKHLLKKK